MRLVFNSALLSLLLPAAVLARPNQHERLHHKRGDFHEIKPHGIHGGPPHIYTHPTGTAGTTAPFPAGNGTLGGPTATGTGTGTAGSGPGSGPVTIISIISVVPIPMSSGQTAPYSPQSGSSGSPSGTLGGSGGAGSGGECGPATVTVTKANTITVTVAAAGDQTSSASAVLSTTVTYAPTESKPDTVAKPAVKAEIAAKPKAELTAAVEPVEKKPAVKVEEAQPKPKVNAAAQPVAEVKAAVKPVVEQKDEAKSPVVGNSPGNSPSQPSASAVPSTAPSTDSAGAKGILYKDLSMAQALTGMTWGTNWDSSPLPAVGKAQGNLGYEFVPQLWGSDDVHTYWWSTNSPGHSWVMGFNEPNIGLSGGGCGPMTEGQAKDDYVNLLKVNKAAGQNLTSPCVSNDANDWLDNFLQLAVPELKPDALCFHWYGNDLDGLKGTVETYKAMQAKYEIYEIWMSEWAFLADLSSEDASDVMSFLKTSGLDKYAYNSLKWTELGTPNMKAAYLA